MAERGTQGGAAKAGAERIEAELNARVREIGQAERERGNARAASPVSVRHVDPATLRPPGWKPPLVQGPTADRVLAFLENGPATVKVIAQAIDVGEITVRNAVNRLIGAELVSKHGEERTGGPPAAVFGLAEQNGDRPAEAEGVRAVHATPEVAPPETVEDVVETPVGEPADEEVLPTDGKDDPEPEPVVCKRDGCENTFTPSKFAAARVFCSTRCQDAASKARTRGEGFQPKECRRCGNEFRPHANSQTYCSDECRDAETAERKAEGKRKVREGAPTAAKQRYLDLLFEKAADPDASEELLDRLERVVGVD